MTIGLQVMLRINRYLYSGRTLLTRCLKQRPSFFLLYIRRKLFNYLTVIWLPFAAKYLTAQKVAARVGFDSPDLFFYSAANRVPFPIFHIAKLSIKDSLTNIQQNEIFIRADKAIKREVCFLGSGNVKLGNPIQWNEDFKSGATWPMRPGLNLDLLELHRNSDIKVPWELSRLQWVLPVGQAYMIERNESFAEKARYIIEEWIELNPVCLGPNWACPMDVAIRAISIVWLFGAFCKSQAWANPEFQNKLLVQFYLHAKFIERNLEWADITGNHLTSNLTGLVIISLFLGYQGEAAVWGERAWNLLVQEFPIQVPNDGVSREASVHYHRLITELFLLPALARQTHGLPVPDSYWKKLRKMGKFVHTYTMPNGNAPNWGDADDGRALPLGTQPLNDHQYLTEILSSLNESPAKPVHDETFWWLGAGNATTPPHSEPSSYAFVDSGVYIFRENLDYVFIDAGPVGMGGRGGHGHNDCLSFEASLGGIPIISDSGCYVYTSSWKERNYFRSTSSHNTPKIDQEEINRIPRWDWLWYMENDAKPEIRYYTTAPDRDLLVAAHSGYHRLLSPVTPIRLFALDKHTHSLIVSDDFEGNSEHFVQIPFHLSVGTSIAKKENGIWELVTISGTVFTFICSSPEKWESSIRDGWISPSYGIKQKAKILIFERNGFLEPLTIAIFPKGETSIEPEKRLSAIMHKYLPLLNNPK